MKASEYIKYDAIGLAELVKKKEVSADELFDTALSIAEKVQPKIGALCNVREEAARKRIKDGLPEGIFSGVPFVLKDIKAVCSDIPMSLGSRFFANMSAPIDNAMVKRYRQSGLNIFGRSTTSELALYIGTESRDTYGYDTANPWDVDYSPGGSSGGASAAVAAGIMPMAHATDGAGSIRLPAANCGLVGLKPTRALLPAGPVVGEMWGGMLSDGVVSRTVRDTAASLDATAGPDPGCPYYAPVKGSYLEAIKTPPRKLKIAYSKKMFGGPATPEVEEVIEKTAKLCAELGHEVVEAWPDALDIPLMWKSFFTIMVIATAMSIEDRAKAVGRWPGADDLEEPTLRLLEMNKEFTATDYARAVGFNHRNSRAVAPFFEEYDILLTPIGARPSEKLGYFRDNPPVFEMEAFQKGDYSSYALYEPFANMTGQPAICLPIFWGESGLPVGSHFIGQVGEDATLLQLSAQIEQAVPWFNKLPEMTLSL